MFLFQNHTGNDKATEVGIHFHNLLFAISSAASQSVFGDGSPPDQRLTLQSGAESHTHMLLCFIMSLSR